MAAEAPGMEEWAVVDVRPARSAEVARGMSRSEMEPNEKALKALMV